MSETLAIIERTETEKLRSETVLSHYHLDMLKITRPDLYVPRTAEDGSEHTLAMRLMKLRERLEGGC